MVEISSILLLESSFSCLNIFDRDSRLGQYYLIWFVPRILQITYQSIFVLFQNLKDQILTTNVWLEHVSIVQLVHYYYSSAGQRSATRLRNFPWFLIKSQFPYDYFSLS